MNELLLNRELIEGTKIDGTSYSFYVYYVVINGIKIKLKPTDETAKEILANYFDSNK